MRRHWKLTIDGAVSPAMVQNIVDVQQILHEWYPLFDRVSIQYSKQHAISPLMSDGKSVATFFSGGVDSFYTLQSHLDEIDQLIFVHGLDIPLRKSAVSARSAHSVRVLADRLGLNLVEVKTNLREFGQMHVSWLDAYFGAALGAVALLLSPRFKKIYLPASMSVSEMRPMGSHPDLDKYWNNKTMQLVHDGIETRFKKIRTVSKWNAAKSHLRVCYQNDSNGINCGRCRKCLWTMMMLRAVGRLDDFTSFSNEMDLHELQLYVPVSRDHEYNFQEVLAVLTHRNTDPVLTEIVQNMLCAAGNMPLKGKLKLQLKRCRLFISHSRNFFEKK